MEKCFTRPTLKATPGDLSLVIPKRQLDNIIEMIYALDKIAPGTANEDTLLYGCLLYTSGDRSSRNIFNVTIQQRRDSNQKIHSGE